MNSVDAGEILKAASQKGWEAGMVVFMLVACLGFLVWLVRSWLKQAEDREKRMAERIDKLEDFQRTTLMEVVKENSAAMQNLTDTLRHRPCIASASDISKNPL